MDMFFGIIFIAFMFIGVLFCAYALLYNLLKPKGKRGAIVLLFDENSADLKAQLAFVDVRLTLSGIDTAIIADNGMNNIQLSFCEQFCRDNPAVILVKAEKITEVLEWTNETKKS